VATDRELKDILWAYPESECTLSLSDDILFYIAGYSVRSLSGSVKCEPGAEVGHPYTWDHAYFLL